MMIDTTKALIDKHLTPQDYESSATALMIKQYISALETLRLYNIKNIVDLGCGFGGITSIVGDLFSAESIIGVDIDISRLEVARSRGAKVLNEDFYNSPTSLNDGTFDLVICNGVLSHLPFFDNVIVKTYQLLKDGGHAVFTVRNAANYIERISLLLGYQPNDALISNIIRTGCMFYNKKISSSHIHGATVKAIRELLEYYRFKNVRVFRGSPRLTGPYEGWARLFKIIDGVMPLTLSRMLIVIAEK